MGERTMPETPYTVTSRRPQGLVDLVAFGNRLEGARKQSGFRSREALSAAVEKQWGVKIPVSALLRIEQQQRLPSLEQALALTLTLKPDIGFEHFTRALRPDALREWDTFVRDAGRKP